MPRFVGTLTGVQGPLVIVGAGLTGLSCALHAPRPALLFERDAAVGGAARTVERGGYLFDRTGHWLHLRDPQVEAMVHRVMPEPLVSVARRAVVYSHGVYTAYPFQAHTHGLPPEVVADCVLGFFAARQRAREEAPTPRSFGDFIRARLGEGIARHFMVPYNTKLWTVPPDAMDFAWCERFVPLPTAEEVVWGALTPEGAGRALGYNVQFWYPPRGGIGALAAALRAALPAGTTVACNRPVERVDWRRRRVWVDGEPVAYGQLVSTMPLPDLIACMDDVPEAVRHSAAQLGATSVTYWDVGLRAQPSDPAWHWAYYPEPAVPFFRAGSASAAMPSMAPPGRRSFYVEVAHRRGTPCPVDDVAVRQAMTTVGLLRPDDVPEVFARSTIGCAYAILDHAYGAARQAALSWLQEVGIVSAGRYGAWVYDSMEGALRAGWDAAQRLKPMPVT